MSAKRRIFVGDVQGCREEFEELLEATRFDPAGDELISVGDLVNRGPDNIGVLRLARRLDVRAVLGNHDLHALARLRGSSEAKRRDTLDDLLRAEDREALAAWLAALPFVLAWPDVVCVHAGLHPRWKDPARVLARRNGSPPPEAVVRFVTGVRYCDGNGRRPARDEPPPPPPFRPWYEFRLAEEPIVVFGHWAQRGLVVERGVRGLDTGCVWGGRLSAWIAEEDRIASVPARRAWAPHGGD